MKEDTFLEIVLAVCAANKNIRFAGEISRQCPAAVKNAAKQLSERNLNKNKIMEKIQILSVVAKRQSAQDVLPQHNVT